MSSATKDDLANMKRSELIREAKQLGVPLPGFGQSGMTKAWLREQISAKRGRPSMTVKTPTLNAPPPLPSSNPDLPLLQLADQVLTAMEIQPPLSEYQMVGELEPDGQSLVLELSCRVGGVSAHVNTADMPERLVHKIEGLTRADFGPANQRGLRMRINAENRAMRTELAQLQGHMDTAGNSVPVKPDLINDPAELKAKGQGPPRG